MTNPDADVALGLALGAVITAMRRNGWTEDQVTAAVSGTLSSYRLVAAHEEASHGL